MQYQQLIWIVILYYCIGIYIMDTKVELYTFRDDSFRYLYTNTIKELY